MGLLRYEWWYSEVGATNGHALKINSATATGLEWGAVTTTGEDDQIVLAVQVFG